MFFLLKNTSEHIDCSFDNPVSTFLTKNRKFCSLSPELTKKQKIETTKTYRNLFLWTHIWQFKSSVKIISTKSRKNFDWCPTRIEKLKKAFQKKFSLKNSSKHVKWIFDNLIYLTKPERQKFFAQCPEVIHKARFLSNTNLFPQSGPLDIKSSAKNTVKNNIPTKIWPIFS